MLYSIKTKKIFYCKWGLFLSLRMIYNNDSYKTYLPYSFPLVNYKALKPNMAGFDQCLSVATCAMSRNWFKKCQAQTCNKTDTES